MDLFSTLQLLHEAVMSVLVTTIYGRWRGTITILASEVEETITPVSYPIGLTELTASLEVLNTEVDKRSTVVHCTQTSSSSGANVVLLQCGVSPFTFESFPNKFRIWNNSSSWFMCNTSKIC